MPRILEGSSRREKCASSASREKRRPNYANKQDKVCKLSGLPIGWADIGRNHTASIDRIDSNKGYVLSNIQLVHKDVNVMKSKYDQNYFISTCQLVAKRNED